MPRPELSALESLAVPTFPHAGEIAGVWAIEPHAGSALWQQVRGIDLHRHMAESPKPKVATEYLTVTAPSGGRVAQVNLTGTLMKAASSMSSATSTVAARRAIRKAAADPEVDAILIAIDSPGGTVSGTADLGSEIAAAAKRKPVWSYIDDLGASAAYWAASQAERVVANNNTALVGSIGTLLVVYDLSGAADKEGIKTHVFGTGPIKGAGTPGSVVSDEQQAYFRGIVNDAQVEFDAAVRKGRSLTAKELANVKTGGVFGATEALDRKLIDAIQSYDQTVAELAIEAKRRGRINKTTRADGPVPVRSATVIKTTDENTDTVATNEPASAEAVIQQQRATFAAESRRVAGINKVCAKHPEIAAEAVEKGWSVEKAENAALKADLADPKIRAVNADGGPSFAFGVGRFQKGNGTLADGVTVNVALEAAIRMALGSKVEKDYAPAALQAADENFRGFGLQQLLLLAAMEGGYHARPGERVGTGNLKPILRAAFAEGERSAGVSTVSLPGILGNVANKEILAGYMEDDQTWRQISRVRPVQNFQTHTSYRLLDDMEYELVGPAGKIKHGSVGEESYTRAANTYAKMFTLTRRDIINDDLGAFQDVRTRLGRGSSKKFNKVFWAEWLADNATFYTAARTNYISGSTTNLGTDGVGLGLGVKAFRQMRSPTADGSKAINADTQNPVGGAPGGRPEILLVPPELESIAEVLYRNLNLGAVKNSDANIYAGKYKPVVAWQLSDSAYAGYSSTAWWLLNNPAYLAAVVVSCLNGNESPTVESADADFDTLGVQFRGYHDFGVDQAEYLAGVKSKGAA